MTLDEWAAANGYVCARQLDDDRVLAVAPMTFGKFRLIVGTRDWIDDGY